MPPSSGSSEPRAERSSWARTCGPAPLSSSPPSPRGDRPGRRRRPDRAGVHRPAVLRQRQHGPARRDVHRQPQPGPLQRHQALPRGRGAGGRRLGSGRHPPACRGRCARRRRPAGLGPGAGRAPRVRRVPPLPGRPAREPPPARRRRRRQRDGRAHRADRARRPPDRPGADVLRARRHLPPPRGQPARPGQPGRPAGTGGRRGAPTSGSPSTATPTAASSSTSAASRSRPPRSRPWSRSASSRGTPARR